MLTESPRHTHEDLEIWRGYEMADLSHGATMHKKVEKSLDLVRSFVAKGSCYCSVSWGKDSVATADLVLRVSPSTPIRHLRINPSHNPECDRVRDAFLAIWLPDYAEQHVDYGGIVRSVLGEEYDKETDRRFFAGFRAVEKTLGTKRHISGIRSSESMGRRRRQAVHGANSINTCAPITHWTDQDVFGYLAVRGLPVHPNYAMLGGGRWDRRHIRTAEIGDVHGRGIGRAEWEREYYGDVLARMSAKGGAA